MNEKFNQTEHTLNLRLILLHSYFSEMKLYLRTKLPTETQETQGNTKLTYLLLTKLTYLHLTWVGFRKSE